MCTAQCVTLHPLHLTPAWSEPAGRVDWPLPVSRWGQLPRPWEVQAYGVFLYVMYLGIVFQTPTRLRAQLWPLLRCSVKYIVLCLVCSVQCTMCSIQCTMCSVQVWVCSVNYRCLPVSVDSWAEVQSEGGDWGLELSLLRVTELRETLHEGITRWHLTQSDFEL